MLKKINYNDKLKMWFYQLVTDTDCLLNYPLLKQSIFANNAHKMLECINWLPIISKTINSELGEQIADLMGIKLPMLKRMMRILESGEPPSVQKNLNSSDIRLIDQQRDVLDSLDRIDKILQFNSLGSICITIYLCKYAGYALNSLAVPAK